MQSWSAVVEAVGERYEILEQGKRHITVANENGKVTISLAAVMNGPLLVVTADVSNPLAQEPSWALRQNGELAIGALAQTEDGCVVRQTAFGDTVSPDSLSLTIDLIAEAAARLSAAAAAPATVAPLFAGWAD